MSLRKPGVMEVHSRDKSLRGRCSSVTGDCCLVYSRLLSFVTTGMSYHFLLVSFMNLMGPQRVGQDITIRESGTPVYNAGPGSLQMYATVELDKEMPST